MTTHGQRTVPDIIFSADDPFAVEAEVRRMQHAYLGRAIRSGIARLYRSIREAVVQHREMAARRRAYEHLFRRDDRLLEDIGLTRGLLGEWVKTGLRPNEAANDGRAWNHRPRRFVADDPARRGQAA